MSEDVSETLDKSRKSHQSMCTIYDYVYVIHNAGSHKYVAMCLYSGVRRLVAGAHLVS